MASVSGSHKDLYRVLKVPITATSVEIKDAYRRLAMELHPDRNDGCEKKAGNFKAVTDAYATLADEARRRAYDRERSLHANRYQYGHVHYRKQTVKQRTEHYRKVYTTRPPPGFKTFDHERHFYMHYGDGIMEEEIERARERARLAGAFKDTYESPLGKGFTIPHGNRFHTNDRWRKSKGTKKDKTTGWEYQSAELHDDSISSQAARYTRAKERVVERMAERRKHRKPRTKDGQANENKTANRFATKQEDEGCVIL